MNNGTVKLEELFAATEFVLVRLHIGRWRAKSRLRLPDLGLPETERSRIQERLVMLGQKVLLPIVPSDSEFYERQHTYRTYADVLNSIEQSARAAVNKEAADVVWGKAVKVTRLPLLVESLEKYKTKYFSVRDEIIARWDELQNLLRQQYHEFATESAARLAKLTEGISEETFIDALLEQIRHSIPSRDEFEASFYFDLETTFIDTTGWFDEKAKENALRQLLTDPKLAAEREAYQKALQERQRILDELNKDLKNNATELVTMIRTQVFGGLYATATEIIEGIQKKGGITSGTIQKLKTLMDITERGISSDTDMKNIKDAVHSMLNSEAYTATKQDVLELSRAIAQVAYGALLDNEEVSRTARQFGISDDTVEIQRARRFIVGITEEINEMERRSR